MTNFPLQDEFLQHKQTVNFYDQRCTFSIVLFVVEKLKSYINFSDQDLCQLKAEFLFLQSHLRYVGGSVKEAAIHHSNKEHAVIYRIDVLWYHLSLQKVPRTSRSKFHNLLSLVRVVSCIIHSNAEEESVSLHVRKNLTPQCTSFKLDGTLSSILSYQLSRPVGVNRYQYKPSKKVSIKV